ncbi:MAG: NADH-quinone oxidoreductase subunit B, partial [Phycisphaerae bacterium]
MGLTMLGLKKSPWVYHVNVGACNNCDIEILELLTPRYDVERFGM